MHDKMNVSKDTINEYEHFQRIFPKLEVKKKKRHRGRKWKKKYSKNKEKILKNIQIPSPQKGCQQMKEDVININTKHGVQSSKRKGSLL